MRIPANRPLRNVLGAVLILLSPGSVSDADPGLERGFRRVPGAPRGIGDSGPLRKYRLGLRIAEAKRDDRKCGLYRSLSRRFRAGLLEGR